MPLTQTVGQNLMDITEAKKFCAGKVIVWNNHRHGSTQADKYLWLAEKNDDVIDYARKKDLIAEALENGEQVVLFTIHRGGQVSIREILPNKACSGRFATRLIVNGRSTASRR